MKNKIIAYSCAFLMMTAPAAYADFTLSDMIVDFQPDSPRQHDIKIVSMSKETQYIAAETYVIENPKDENEKRVLVTDPQKSGLMVTPNKMVLPANAQKVARLLLLKPQTDQDQIFRVTFKPVIDGVEPDKNQQLSLKLLVGYEALVIVRPKEPKIELTAERKGNALTITNKGNTNAYLQAGEQCNATGGDCKEVQGERIYAGQSWTVTLPHLDGKAKFTVWDGKKSEQVSF